MRESDITPRTVSVETAARILGIGRSLAYELAAKGELPGAIRLGNRLVVSVDAIESTLRGDRAPWRLPEMPQ